MWFLTFIACSNEPTPRDQPVETKPETSVVLLDTASRASRISLALRGIRPSRDQLDRLAAEPELLPVLVDEWIDDEHFAETVRDLHADLLWMRADTRAQWPNAHQLEGYTKQEVAESFQEAPLKLVEHIVVNKLPYSEILTADYTITDKIVSIMEGLPFDPNGDPWQVSYHVDGRPQSGLLSSTGLWQRWYTNNSGKHRNRANMVSRVFLCDEIGAFDMPVFPTADPTNNLATADALRNDPGCVFCHVNLDPMAAYFWPYELNITAERINPDDGVSCDESPGKCYPVRFWAEKRADSYLNYDLPPPGYYGEPGADFADLGVSLSEDPRFASCAVQTAWVFFTQRNITELPLALNYELLEEFVASGLDYSQLVRALVLSPEFSNQEAPAMQLRPEALDRTLQELTGYRWSYVHPSYGTVPVLQNSVQGARDLAGGGDHDHVLHSNFSPSPTVLLTWDAATRLAAEHAVNQGVVLDASLTAPADVEEQLIRLVTNATGKLVTADDLMVVRLIELHSAGIELSGDPAEAWRITLRGLLLDPLVVTY